MTRVSVVNFFRIFRNFSKFPEWRHEYVTAYHVCGMLSFRKKSEICFMNKFGLFLLESLGKMYKISL
jgi:hypothetical protein